MSRYNWMIVEWSNGLCIGPCGAVPGKVEHRVSLLDSLLHLIPCSHHLWDRQHGQEEIIHSEGDGALERIFQRSCGCSMPRSVQVQAGWGSEEPGLMGGILAHGKEVLSLWFFSTQNTLWFYDSTTSHCRFFIQLHNIYS